MQLATVRVDGVLTAARVEDEDLVLRDATDVGGVFAQRGTLVREAAVNLTIRRGPKDAQAAVRR